MENQEQQSPGLFELQFDENAKSSVKTMATWAMVIVITSLVSYVLTIVKYFKQKNDTESVFNSEDFDAGSSMMRTAGTSLVNVVISVLIGFLVTYFLYMFASKAKKGMEGLSEYDVNIGFANFKNYFLVIGILVIIGLVFFLFAMIAVGTMAGMN